MFEAACAYVNELQLLMGQLVESSPRYLGHKNQTSSLDPFSEDFFSSLQMPHNHYIKCCMWDLF